MIVEPSESRQFADPTLSIELWIRKERASRMDQKRAIEILERQRATLSTLLGEDDSSAPAFMRWRRDTEVAIDHVFGAKGRHHYDFRKIEFGLVVLLDSTTPYEHVAAFRDGLASAKAVLDSMIGELKQYGLATPPTTRQIGREEAGAIARRQTQLERMDRLTSEAGVSSIFELWHRDTDMVLRRTFDEDHPHLAAFRAVRYQSSFTGDGDESERRSFRTGVSNAKALLMSIIGEIRRFGFDQPGAPSAGAADLVESLCRRFPEVVGRLRTRHKDRPALVDIIDEYDVQDLMHALLAGHFDDIRAEERTPSSVGGSARIDFVLKPERIALEVKMIRDGLRDAKTGAELLEDIGRPPGPPGGQDPDLLRL